ncbi:hypothetical protein BASA83_012959 [Batrachochytrium salamandrivorans]|nr:hypothetical protein BASA83_012959 [Batrachochytrium salamandrivorans]
MKKVTFEEMLESMSARLHLIEAENESLKMDAQESRAIANRAMLENTVSSNSLPYTKEPRVCLPDKFDGTRKNFRGFINQLELVFQLQSDRYNTDQKMIATLGTLLTGNALAWQGNQSCSVYVALFHQLTADLDWNDSALRAQFYFGLSYEIKDALVHFDTPSTLSLAIQQAIKVDNRLYERRLERTEVRGVTPYSSPNRFFPPTRPQPPTPRTSNTPWNQPQRRPPPPSPMVVPPPRSSNDMDIDFARRGPLTSEERQQRMSRGLCLVCGQSGHLKANCPKSNPNFRAPKSIRAIQIDDVDFESPGNDPGCL